MADDTTLNQGAGGDVIATDDIGGVKYQRVKLVEGADGTNDGDISSTNPLPVIGTCYPVTIQSDLTRSANTTAYTAGNAIANSTSAPTTGGFTLSGVVRAAGGSAIITDACFATSNDPTTKLSAELWLFNAPVTAINDNVAFAVSDDEIKTCLGVIPFTMFDAGNNGFCQVQGLSMLVNCSTSANLRYLMRVRNAYTPASSEVITTTLKLLQLD